MEDHGCRVCGRVPTDEGNNVANNQSTVNLRWLSLPSYKWPFLVDKIDVHITDL